MGDPIIVTDKRGKNREAASTELTAEQMALIGEQAARAAEQDIERERTANQLNVTTAYLVCIMPDGTPMAAAGVVSAQVHLDSSQPPRELVLQRPAGPQDISWTSREVAMQMAAQVAALETVQMLMQHQRATQQMSPQAVTKLRGNGINPDSPFLG